MNEMDELTFPQEFACETCITSSEVIVPRDHYEQLVKMSVELNLIRKAYDKNIESYNIDRLFALLFGPRREDGDAE